MIPASEALQLPTAKLTAEELAAADKLEAEIDEHIKTTMKRVGCMLKGKETNPNVLNEVGLRIKKAGYVHQWEQLSEQHRFNAALRVVTGFVLTLAPGIEAYQSSRQV